MQTALSIVIVNWNGEKFLPACLESIRENPPSVPYEVVVVDNNSSDSSIRWLKSEEARDLLGSINFRLIESGENLGYGCGNNLAIEQSDSPFIFILNPDVIVFPNAFDRLLETLISDEGIGAVGPKLLWVDGSLHPSTCNFPPNPFSILVDGLQLGRVIPRRFLAKRLYGAFWNHDERIQVPMIQGAAMMVKREMIEKVGSFDPSIHMFSEELELCVRINRGNWKVFFEPDAQLVHFGGKSTEQRWDETEIQIVQQKAMIVYYRKCFSQIRNFFNDLAALLVFAVHYVRWKLKGRDTVLFRELIKLHLADCMEIVTGQNSVLRYDRAHTKV